MFQIKKNPHKHTYPPGGGGGKAKTKLEKTRWVADAILDWLREEPRLGPTAHHGKLFEKYKIEMKEICPRGNNKVIIYFLIS